MFNFAKPFRQNVRRKAPARTAKLIIFNSSLDIYMERKPFFLTLFLCGLLAATTLCASPAQKSPNPRFGWGSVDVRYPQDAVPGLTGKINLRAWRGERVSAQAVLQTPADIHRMTISTSDLTSGKNRIDARQIKTYFVGYLWADTYKDKNGKFSCGARKAADYDSNYVADRLYEAPQVAVAAGKVQPVWLDIRVPQTAAAGKYSGQLTAECDGRTLTLPLTVEVTGQTLPEPKDWAFHLDLWQNPYAVARYWNVPLWSKAHFDRMRPLMELLAAAGQKVITCSVIRHPWNSQTEDPFESMIMKIKKLDGRWTYDYSVFDRWVEFMMSCGITQQIDCYTIVPWHYQFDYYDMASNSTKLVACKPGEKTYEEFMLSFLTDFAAHLKQKGWFDRTCIAMDERPMDQLNAAYDIVKRADPNWRIEGAAHYFPDVEPKMYDLSLTYEDDLLPAKVLSSRREAGRKVTFYTCCGPAHPNTFTFSPPAESAWMGWHAAAIGYDGYLRWAYNSWTKDPLHDSRFRTWASGDCFLVYPDGSSIRMERLVQGIQDFEKVRLLKQKASTKQLKKLNETLKAFESPSYDEKTDAALTIRNAEAVLRSLE